MNRNLTMLGASSSSSQPFTKYEIMLIESRSVLSPYPFMQFQSKNILQLNQRQKCHWNNSTDCQNQWENKTGSLFVNMEGKHVSNHLQTFRLLAHVQLIVKHMDDFLPSLQRRSGIKNGLSLQCRQLFFS